MASSASSTESSEEEKSLDYSSSPDSSTESSEEEETINDDELLEYIEEDSDEDLYESNPIKDKKSQDITKVRPLDSYDNPYVSRDDRNIQSLWCAKKEIQECASGPNPSLDVRVDDIFFNYQEHYARLLTAYGSCICVAEPGSGKTGAIECFRSYIRKQPVPEIVTYYYIAAETQIGEFKDQITKKFAPEYDRARLKSAHKDTAEIGDNKNLYKAEIDKTRTLARHYIKQQGYITITAGAFSNKVKSMTNSELIQEFSTAFIAWDEAHQLKLTEEKDEGSIKDRKRLKDYKAIWRVSQIVPSCVISFLTGTPITNRASEFIYMLNLLPNTVQIKTDLSWKIAKSMAQKKNLEKQVPFPTKWRKVSLHYKNKNLEKQLEKVARGRITYIRAPVTGVVQAYNTGTFGGYGHNKYKHEHYDKQLAKTTTNVTMSVYQALFYLQEANSDGKKAKSSKGNKDSLFVNSTQAAVFVFPTQNYAEKRLKCNSYKEVNRKYVEGLVGDEGLKEVLDTPKIVNIEKVLTSSYYVQDQRKKIERVYKKKMKGVSGPKLVKLNTQLSEALKFKKTIKIPRYKKWMQKYLANDDCLAESGIKVYDVVMHFFHGKEGLAYLSSRFEKTTCGVIGEALKVRNAIQFNPLTESWIDSDGKLTIRKEPRFAIISSKNKQQHRGILDLAAHPNNILGEYLRLVMGTPVATVGLNIINGWRSSILEPNHTTEKDIQSVYRVLRPSAHSEIINQLDRKKYAKWFTKDGEFKVFIGYYVAELPTEIAEKRTKKRNEQFYSENELSDDGGPLRNITLDDEDEATIDWQIYHNTHLKDKENAPARRAIKIISIDFPINMGRNIRDTDVDGSMETDYREKFYTAYKYTPLPIDTSTYDSYYIDGSIDKVTKNIGDMIIAQGKQNIEELASHFIDKQYSQIEVLSGIKFIVENEIVIGKTRLGFDTFLQEEGGVLYPTVDKGLSSDRMLEYYYDNPAIIRTRKLEDIAEDYINEDRLNTFKKKIDTMPEKAYREYVSTLPDRYRIKVFEDAAIEIQTKDDVWIKRVLEVFSLLFYRDSIEDITVHQLGNVVSKGTKYAPLTIMLAPYKGSRIYRGGVWSNCNSEQLTYYSQRLGDVLLEGFQPYYDIFGPKLGFMGVITVPGAIHIREIVYNKNKNIYFGKFNVTIAKIPQFKALELVYATFAALGKTSPGNALKGRKELEAVNKYSKSLNKQFDTVDLAYLKGFSVQKLKDYLKLSNKSRNSLVIILCKNLKKLKAIFAIVGDVNVAVETTVTTLSK